MSKIDFRSGSLDEVRDFLSKVYANQGIKLFGKEKDGALKARVVGAQIGGIAVYQCSYHSRFSYVSEAPRRSHLIIACTGGTATYRQDRRSAECRAGMVLPISASATSRCDFGPSRTHVSAHLDSDLIDALCSRWVGRELPRPVEFALTPFSAALTARWVPVVKSLAALYTMDEPPVNAVEGLQEYAIGLLLELHPHNYSRLFHTRRAPARTVVADAMRYVRDNPGRVLSPAKVAEFFDCSVRSLDEGFRRHAGLSMHAYLQAGRLQKARSLLEAEQNLQTSIEVACRLGFIDLHCFERSYSDRYRETPEDTARRVRGGAYASGESEDLSPAAMAALRDHIDASIGRKISSRALSKVAGLRPHQLFPAFKKAFGTTPAQYIISERLTRARWLLKHTDESIASVAADTGFSSQSHLTTVLKRFAGMTPRQYRAKSYCGA